MKLDNEAQRQQLIQVINALSINGNLQQVTQAANFLIELVKVIERAGLEPAEAA